MLIFLFIFCLKYKPGEGKQCVVDTVDWPILLLSQFPSGVTSFTAKARKLKKRKKKKKSKQTKNTFTEEVRFKLDLGGWGGFSYSSFEPQVPVLT